MRLEAVNSSKSELSWGFKDFMDLVSPESDLFEVLGEVYLDPLLKQRPFFWIGIYEKLEAEARQRVCRGPLPPCYSFEFGKGNVGQAAEKGVRKVVPDVKNDSQYTECFAQTASEWVEPIKFNHEIVGVLDIEEDKKNAFSDSDTKIFVELAAQIAPLFAWREVSWQARLETLQALYNLRRKKSHFDWVGIYRRNPKNRDVLTVSAYIGDPTEHINIPISKGICGAAIREDRTIHVPNVRSDPRFIACSVKTQSELVVPIRNSKGEAVAEIDIDSNRSNAFTPERIADVEACAAVLEKIPGLFS